MIKRAQSYIKALSAVAFGTAPAGRNVSVFPDDVFLVSYFRSGSTWSRFLFGNLVHQSETVDFANVNRLVPSIYANPDRKLRKLPRILKSHECFDPRYPRVIFLVRDPRDVAVSFYHYNLKMRTFPDGFPLGDFVARFVAGKTVPYADRLGSWEDHTMSWVRMRQGKENFLLIRYEDLLSAPDRELTRAAALLGIEPSPERIQRAIDLSSASQMRSLEQKQWKQFSATKDGRQDIPFVREATSGGWRKRLSETSVRVIEQAWGPAMQSLGYELTQSISSAENSPSVVCR
jgi:estrone sulfotransferase